MATKFSASDDIYRNLAQGNESNLPSDESWLYGLVAFAVIEERRISWAEHYNHINGKPPDSDEIRNWYEQQPESELLGAKGRAEDALQAYSDKVVESAIKEREKEIEEGIIVNAINRLSGPWRQLRINIVGGFIGALLFAMILAMFSFIGVNDISPVQIGKHLKGEIEKSKTEVMDNGQ